MLKEIKTVFQIAIKTCLIVCLLFGSYQYLNRVFYNREVYRGETLHSLPENSLDVLVLGSSHAQYSFVPSFFYQETGLYSLVLGSACQPLEVSYEMLKEALKTQDPSVVILEVFTAMPLHYGCLADSCYVLAEYQMTGEEKYNTIGYLPEEKRSQYLNDFFTYHNDWKTMEDIDRLLPRNALKKYGLVTGDFGYVYQAADLPPVNWWYPLDNGDVEAVPLEEKDLDSLNKIYDLCQKEGINLYLYKTAIDGFDEENNAYLNGVWEWAKERNIPYTDFCTEADDMDYALCIQSDSAHAFINGAGLITQVLAERVQVSDSKHTEVPELTERYTANGNGYTMEYLAYEFNPYRILKRLASASGMIMIRYNSGEYFDDRLAEYLSKVIGKEFDPDSDLYLLMNEGRIIAESSEPFKETESGHTIEFTADDILFDGESTGCKGSFSIAYSYDSRFPVAHSFQISGNVWEIGYDYYTKQE
ncbi:MAG: hypothetical protein IIZ80_09985 [Erysipelotrichaceae bacterium]|nr:hypothetical protein [Erysipelotrichaceae bacterium]MBR2749520.1 hypothetical protein [Clostridiales bacterium]